MHNLSTLLQGNILYKMERKLFVNKIWQICLSEEVKNDTRKPEYVSSNVINNF